MTSTRASKPVGAFEIAAFASPAGPLLALTLPTIIFLPPHFITGLGLSEKIVAGIFLAGRLFDLFLDPLMGTLQDRTKTRFGRRRVWLAAACPLLMAAIYFVFIYLGPGASWIAATLGFFAMYFVFAMMMVAHLGWSGELIPTYQGRTRVLGAVQTASLLGEVALLATPAVVKYLGGSDTASVAAMGWALIIMLPITTALAVFGAREREAPPQAPISILAGVRTVLNNKTARRVLIPDLLLGVAQGISGGLFLFYFRFILGFERESEALVLIYFVAGLIGVPIWWTIAQRFGKDKALMTAFVYSALTTSALVVMPHGMFAFVAGFMVIAGLAQGGLILLTRSLMADVVDEDELESGARRSGIFFGLMLTTSKIGLASGPLAYAVLQMLGFQATLGESNTPHALMSLSWMFIGIPVLLCAIGAVSMRKYPLDEKRQAALAAAISARHAENSENTLGPSTK